MSMFYHRCLAWYNGYMSSINIKYDDGKVMTNFVRMAGGVTDAVRDTLNEMAMIAAHSQRAYLPRVFTLRNKWVSGSIWPKLGKRKGLVPHRASNINRMYSTSGTVSPYLERQEGGWAKKDPSVPSDEVRIGRNHRRIIRKQYRKKQIDKQPTLTPDKTMARIPDRKERVSAMLAMANQINWKGLIEIENDRVMPAGYYQIRGGSLRLLRRNQTGYRFRRAIEWHEKSIALSGLSRNAQRVYDRNIRVQLSKLY